MTVPDVSEEGGKYRPKSITYQTNYAIVSGDEREKVLFLTPVMISGLFEA